MSSPPGTASTSATLSPPGSAVPARQYLQRMWDMRHFAVYSARHGMSSQHARSFLGNLWLLLEPALLITVYFLIFGLIADISRGVDNFLAFLAVGNIVFTHSRRGITLAAGSVANNSAMLNSFAFPRALLPTAAVINSLFTYAVSLVVLGIVLPIIGEAPRLGWLWMIPLTALQAIMNLGIGFFLARFVAQVRDLGTALTYMFRLTFYASGVIFPVERFIADRPNADLLTALLHVNPFYDVIALSRWATLGQRPVEPVWAIGAAVAWGLVSLGAGFFVFLRHERRYSGSRTLVVSQ